MNKGRNMRVARRGKGSFLWQTVDRFTAFLYSLFIFGRFGESLASQDTYCKRSYLAKRFSGRSDKSKKFSLTLSESISKTLVFRALSALRGYIAFLKLNVYGTFFAFYGLTAALVYIISMLIRGQNIWKLDNINLVVSALSVMILALPLLFSSHTATGAIAKSRFARRFILDFLDIPEEKLKSSKAYGGKEHVLFAVIFGLIFGGATYFMGPWYLPAAFAVLIGLFAIFVNPESGIILTVTAIPFFQFAGVMRTGLVIMILITSVAYVCKIAQRRRKITLSPEICMVLLFCAFIIASSIFAHGGKAVMWDAVSYVIIILGGFFLTYNLITSQKGIKICTKTMMLALVVCAFVGIWNGFYNGISHRLSDPVTEQLTNMSKVDIMAMFDSGWVFGIMAVLIFPLLFAYITKQKSAKGISAMMIACILVGIACWMCTRYEIVIALLVESIVFWLLYSHKSLTAIIIAAIPVTTVILLYPYAVANWHIPDIARILTENMPASSQNSAVNTEAVKVVFSIIFNGNIAGIGAGDQAIRAVLPTYTSSLSYSDIYGASVWLQILCWSGIFGFISFIVFIGFVIKRSFRCFARPYQKEYQGIGIALFSAIVLSLVLGLISNIWVNDGMMYLFWINAGLLLSHIRSADNELEKRTAGFAGTSDTSDTEIIFYK